jgi:hypothetical protein
MTRQVLWVGFLLRVLVAVWNGFFGPSFGADGDAAGFHDVAATFSQDFDLTAFHLGLMYAYALGGVYFLTTDSLFVGSVLSCIAWFASACILTRMMRLLSFSRQQQVRAMLVYALVPSSILWTGVTLREPYELLFVNLALYSSLRIYLNQSSKHWLLLTCAVVLGGILHGGLFGFGLFILVATSAWVLVRRRSLAVAKLIVVIPFIGLVLVYGYSLFTATYSYAVADGLSGAIQSHQQGALNIEARTHYKTSVSIDGATDLMLFIPVSFLQYLFEPMPWRVASPADLVVLFENLLRAWLIWRALNALRRIRSPERKPLLLIFSSYIVLETIWSVGTINWGTAARHHIPGMGLLVIAAFAQMRRRRREREHRAVDGLVAAPAGA